jgi:hypothetical protein
VSKITYFELIEAYCLLTDVKHPRMITDGGTLHINGVAFSLLHNEQIDETLLYIYADFGALPPGRELQASMALLEANLFLYSGSTPVFAIAPGTERVVMAQVGSLAQLDAESLSALLTNMADKACQWRKDYFLDPQSNPFQLAQHAQHTQYAPSHR